MLTLKEKPNLPNFLTTREGTQSTILKLNDENQVEVSINLHEEIDMKNNEMKTTFDYVLSTISKITVIFLFSLHNGLAIAAPPPNDIFSGVTAASDGFSETIDTTEAGTDSDDAQFAQSCIGVPATDASVWYSFTANTDGVVIVDASQASYSAGFMVGVGSQGNLFNVACGPSTVSFFASAGTTYYILAFDYQGDGGGNGGSLNISFNQVPAPTVDDITVNKFGSVNPKTGVATISGSYTCSHGGFIDVNGEASQKVGRVATIRGNYGFSDFSTCDGLPHPWSANVIPQSGKFAGGKSMTVTIGFTCGTFQCASGFFEHTVQLRSNSK